MTGYESFALDMLQLSEKFYQGVDRAEMKKTFVEVCIRQSEDCPLFMGLVMVSGLKMLDECPDYH
jgi:hypothetical protein